MQPCWSGPFLPGLRPKPALSDCRSNLAREGGQLRPHLASGSGVRMCQFAQVAGHCWRLDELARRTLSVRMRNGRLALRELPSALIAEPVLAADPRGRADCCSGSQSRALLGHRADRQHSSPRLGPSEIAAPSRACRRAHRPSEPNVTATSGSADEPLRRGRSTSVRLACPTDRRRG